MTNKKLYALKTSDGQCVVKRNGDLIVTNNPYSHDFEKEIISLELSAPCEWVEVWVIEAKAVDDAVIDNLNAYGPVSDDNTDNSSVTWAEGFRSCLRYLGVG